MTRNAANRRDLPLHESIYREVRAVAAGEVVSYGEIARICRTVPVMVGKALASCPEDVPWHRVIGSDGRLPIARRGAGYAAEQRRRLEDEGVRFLADGRVEVPEAIGTGGQGDKETGRQGDKETRRPGDPKRVAG